MRDVRIFRVGGSRDCSWYYTSCMGDYCKLQAQMYLNLSDGAATPQSYPKASSTRRRICFASNRCLYCRQCATSCRILRLKSQAHSSARRRTILNQQTVISNIFNKMTPHAQVMPRSTLGEWPQVAGIHSRRTRLDWRGVSNRRPRLSG